MLPFHPTVVHLPLIVSFLLPVLALIFALMIRSNKMAPKAWLIIVGLQVLTTASGYVSLESGEKEEKAVSKVLDKKLIHEHEEAAEIYVGSTVVALVLGTVAFFIRKEFSLYIKVGVVVVSLISSYLGYATGSLGGDLVYRHGAASAYTNSSHGPEGLLPTPDLNTSESSFPVDENEIPEEIDETREED